MAYPAGYKYTKDHEWVRVDGAEAVVGIRLPLRSGQKMR